MAIPVDRMKAIRSNRTVHASIATRRNILSALAGISCTIAARRAHGDEAISVSNDLPGFGELQAQTGTVRAAFLDAILDAQKDYLRCALPSMRGLRWKAAEDCSLCCDHTHASAGDLLLVRYTGRLEDGTIFDTTQGTGLTYRDGGLGVDRPQIVAINSSPVPGITEGLKQVGSSWPHPPLFPQANGSTPV